MEGVRFGGAQRRLVGGGGPEHPRHCPLPTLPPPCLLLCVARGPLGRSPQFAMQQH